MCHLSELDRVLAQGVDTEDRPVLGFILREDIKGLYNFCLERGYRQRPEGYISLCHLCTDMRAFLAREYDFKELQPVEFYEFIMQL